MKSEVKKLLDKTTIDDRFASSAKKVGKDVRKNITTAILAAFGFMIALVWRDVVRDGVTRLVEMLSLGGSGFWFSVLTAIITTVVCVFGIIYFSRWSEK